MARTSRDDLAVARSSFFMGNTLVRAGDVWAADDPVVRTHPNSFRVLEVFASDPPKPPRPARPALRIPATRGKKATASS